MDKLRKAYQDQKSKAAKRNIDFLFTFEEWSDWWDSTGKLNQRGKGADKYCMARYNDTGPYSKENVFCELYSENVRYAQSGSKNHISKKTHTPSGIFDTARQAAKAFGIDPSAVTLRCANPNFKDWYFVTQS